jgi:hypothetical protein
MRRVAVLSHRQALYELLQGKNNQHSHFALRSQPTFGNQLQSIYRIRNGSDTARMTGGIPKDIETSFYNFASSHARTLSALEVSAFRWSLPSRSLLTVMLHGPSL